MPKADVQAQRRQEFQFQQGRAFDSITSLAKGIVHDFSNVIAGILGSAEVIRMDAPADQPDREVLNQIFTVGARANQILHQLNHFSQRKPCQRTLIWLKPVIEASLPLIRCNLPAAVELHHHLESQTPAIFADAAQIGQLVTSLCANASQSLAGRAGRIEIGLETCPDGGDLPAAHPGLSPVPQLRLSVRDNGANFSKSVVERIFEPFACKHSNGHDCGLELFAVREIVHAHEGTITVASVPGEGTVFRIYFPIPPEENTETPPPGRIADQPPARLG
jgi:nitrogen-specific signal transduction histidine kinase